MIFFSGSKLGDGPSDLPGKLTEAFALVGGAVDKDLCGDDVPEGQEHLQDLRVGELLWQVVDEDVAAFGT